MIEILGPVSGVVAAVVGLFVAVVQRRDPPRVEHSSEDHLLAADNPLLADDVVEDGEIQKAYDRFIETRILEKAVGRLDIDVEDIMRKHMGMELEDQPSELATETPAGTALELVEHSEFSTVESVPMEHGGARQRLITRWKDDDGSKHAAWRWLTDENGQRLSDDRSTPPKPSDEAQTATVEARDGQRCPGCGAAKSPHLTGCAYSR
jgi:hypothetical protein